ncbi:aryl-alcohol dehydrogenase-like predicted oxidoreductase [Oryzihumus leptocrescens]|uniref:Aryl-alcohol dehydrogenase-like predicted oxidoreductase n=2 Tax=Oryzihumus leptocrescens TaxID=297536 RepID=A0A542ZIT9_9MICO|nr:aryl-alcohol dehydrogenase-like predicted oxidoreductase [Oryzihumus leptocrescens]
MGRSGLSVSRLALGTMTWGRETAPDEARDQLAAFLDAGGDLVDTAHGYADGLSEQALGSFLGDLVEREDLAICTKAGISRRSGDRVVDTSRRALMNQLDTSLERLGTHYVDLWLVHTWSPDTPLEETLSALEWAVTSGRARYVGVSNYSGWQSAHAATLMSARSIPLVANEVEYSLLSRRVEDEVAPAAEALGLGLMPWSPLARGVLTGKYRHGIPADSRAASRDYPGFTSRFLGERTAQVVDALVIAARGLEVSPAEVALAWVRDRPGVVAPVVGARTLQQLRTALASESLSLPPELVQALDDVSC